MTSISKARTRGRSRARRYSKDRYRSFGAAATLICILALGGVGGSYLPLAQSLWSQQLGYGEARYRTGTVVIVPTEGDNCQERVIDNATWRIHDKGYIDCDSVLSPNSLQTSDYRIAVIRDGFRNK
jgi:hypothetical protein